MSCFSITAKRWQKTRFPQPSLSLAVLVALTVAEQYVQAFGNLAKTSNTVILPANTSDAASMVAQV